MEDSHPRLLITNYMRTQPMVYDSSIETPRNEVEYMLSQCQKSIDDKNNTWAFMLRQLVDVFIIMAFDNYFTYILFIKYITYICNFKCSPICVTALS